MMQSLDLYIIFGYIAFIFVVAIYSGRGQSSTTLEHHYLADKSLTFWESLCSIIATEVSALTFLGIPAIAFDSNFSFIQIYIGAIFGRIVIAKVFLPKIYDKGITVYSVMASGSQDFGGRKTITIFYMINKLLAVGVRLFSGSIILSEFFNLPILIAVLIICILTFAYTLIGGLKAVVRTDMLQMVLFVAGGFVAHYLIPEQSQSDWYEMIDSAIVAGKTSLWDLKNPWSFLVGVAGGFLFDQATHGVDQDFVQRLTANSSIKSAQKAIIISSFFSIFVGLLFLSIGSLLWSHYQSSPIPTGISSDQLFAHFITNYFPNGLKGIMVAGVLAATMSTLDSTINALSACLNTDLFRNRNPEKINFYHKFDILLITILLYGIAVLASYSDSLLMFGLKITSWTAGSLLAVFFSRVVWRKFFHYKFNIFNIVVCYLFGLSGVALNTFYLQMNWNYNVYLGFSFSIIYLAIAQNLDNLRSSRQKI